MGEERGPGYELCLRPHYAWVQKLFSLMPGARGYLGREKLREADILIRRYAASRLDEAASRLDEAKSLLAAREAEAFFSTLPSLTPIPGAQGGAASPALRRLLEEVSLETQRLSSDILYADSGWAPVSAVQAIREEELRRLCEYDDTMIGLAEKAAERAASILDAVRNGRLDEAEKLLGELREALSALRSLYEERRKYLRFAGESGPGILEKARSLLSKLSRR